MTTTWYLVNVVGHTINEVTNIQNIRDHINVNAQYIPMGFQPIINNIRGLHCRLQYKHIGWKTMCIGETSKKVRSDLYPSYPGGSKSKI